MVANIWWHVLHFNRKTPVKVTSHISMYLNICLFGPGYTYKDLRGAKLKLLMSRERNVRRNDKFGLESPPCPPHSPKDNSILAVA